MNTYWISFRISTEESDAKESYNDRYDNFIVKLEELSSSIWEQTTSFMVFNSYFDIDHIANTLSLQLDRKIDLFLIRAMNAKSAIIFGKNTDKNIFEMMWNDEKGSTYLRKK